VRYEAAIRYLYRLETRGITLGLGRVSRALAARGSPERSFVSVHVAGTNGKGSVAAMIAAALQQSGLRVGLFTSPHLHRLVERFRVDGRSMPQAELARRVQALAPWLERPTTPVLSFFEVCTLLGLEWFRDRRCDVAVLEVGLGGRLDATNVVRPAASVITRIALDHTDRLGPTLRHVAREKAGIVKAGVPLVAGVREPVALAVIGARARRLRAPLLCIDRDFSATARGPAYDVRVRNEVLRGLRSPLAGTYQADNLACAAAALHVLSERGPLARKARARGRPIDERALRRGLSRVRWPGRLELIAGPPDMLCDAAHNPDACAELARHLDGLAGAYARKLLLFGVLRDKDYERMLAPLLPCIDELVFLTPASSRALPSGVLQARFGGRVIDDVGAALRFAQKRAGKRGLIVAAGSIFTMSALRARLLGLREDPKIAL
jgi:dihydrofolate synthase/folylpolyglutamate synthase